MKKIIPVLLIMMICGCSFKPNINSNNNVFEEKYYQITKSCTYFNNKLLLCEDTNDKFIETNNKYIAFVKLLENKKITQKSYHYTLDNNIIHLMEKNNKGMYEIEYEQKKELNKNVFITYEKTIPDESTVMNIQRIYEEISKEDYLNKIYISN